MKHFEVTEKARNDLRSISLYTGSTWGAKKRDHYLRTLARRFQWLAEHPNLGTSRPDIEADYFCYPEGEHLIFYMLVQNVLVIIGIPHKRMDIIGHFQQ